MNQNQNQNHSEIISDKARQSIIQQYENIKQSKSAEPVAVFIGRFQPFHYGHLNVIENAVKAGKYKQIVILIGSAEQARTPRNPFTYEERAKLIENKISDFLMANGIRLSILPIHDSIYDNNKWIAEVQQQVSSVTLDTDKIVLIGNIKDKTSEYLNYFPQYGKDFCGLTDNCQNATDIRNKFFESFNDVQKLMGETDYIRKVEEYFQEKFVETPAYDFLARFTIAKADKYEYLYREYEYLVKYREQMQNSLPFKNIAFFTGDALVTCAGHLLVIKRKLQPGKDLFALPGGFFDGLKDKSLVDTAIRELYEETKIKVSKAKMYGSIVKSEQFGDFNRSERWRIITNTTFIKLHETNLPVVKGADDAVEAFWLPFVDIKKYRDQWFEDHYSIIDAILGV